MTHTGSRSWTRLFLSLTVGGILCSGGNAPQAASDITFTVDVKRSVHPISAYIYGNNQVDFRTAGHTIALTRLGGNRWTAYNWTTNASNAGSDYQNQNDELISHSDAPGEGVRPHIAASRAAGAAIVVTVPMAGYVSADKNGGGDVNKTPDYLKTRFKVSVARKGKPFSLTPDPHAPEVYQDEFVNWVQKTFPGAGTGSIPPIFYSLDNEPDLWSFTHSRIHPQKLTYAELATRSIEYAAAIKDVAPASLIFGPVSYGWHGYETLQDAPDQRGRNFLEYYLATMRDAERQKGRRLLDVLDLHFYSEAHGGGVRVTEAGTKPETQDARLQSTRSLWDPGYVEDSWITKSSTHGAIRLIPRVREMIRSNYPGTRLAFTEYNFGAGGDISGGLAEADALGIFGKEGVFAAAWWELGGGHSFTNGAFALFRNYDGAGSTFGDTSVQAENPDPARASVYAAIQRGRTDRVFVVAINKTRAPLPARISLAGAAGLRSASTYLLTAGSPVPAPGTAIPVSKGSELRYTMPPFSATMLVVH